MSTNGHQRHTVAVDFDGVIHSYSSPWVAPEVIPDPPVQGVKEWLLELSDNFTVYIHTTRARTPEGKAAVEAYVKKLTGRAFKVTNKKIPAIIYIDDRGWRYEGGAFPTVRQIKEAVPWTKRGSRAMAAPK